MGECSPGLLWLWVLVLVVARPLRGHPWRPGRPVSILSAVGTPLCWRPLAVRSFGVPQQTFEGPWGPLEWCAAIPPPGSVQCHYHIFATLVYVAAPHRFLSPSFLPPRLSHGAIPWCVSLPQPCYGRFLVGYPSPPSVSQCHCCILGEGERPCPCCAPFWCASPSMGMV